MVPTAPVDPLTGVSASRFGIYVHFPYCLSKCPYCDFASIVAREVPEVRYRASVLEELSLRLREMPSLCTRPVDSIFIGGGTPSLWGASHVGAVLQGLAGSLQIATGAEITLEANPGASDAQRFREFRSAGVNRLSLGVQSFQPQTLAALGRAHDGAGAIAAYRAAREAGFDNVSLDFIYGVHGQMLEQVVADAKQAVSLQPEHLSAYALTLDKESLAEEVPLARAVSRGEVVLPPDDTVVAMAEEIGQRYGEAGLVRYETSNYARPGYHSRHNTLYWTGGEYLALGAGGTGFLRQGQKGTRYQNPRSAEVYLGALSRGHLPPSVLESLSNEELFEERLAMGLRLSSGVDIEAVCREYGQPVESRRKVSEALVRDGFAEHVHGRFRLTPKGANVHSAICARLL
jgi:putative oxygen-independent coproporphyrinogen III oxidase